MSDILQLTIRKALKKPGKAFLQAAVIAAGALAFSAGLSIAGSIAALERETYRYRVSIAAGQTDEAGRFQYERTSPFTVDIIDGLSLETAYIRRAAAVNQTNWPAVKVGESRYSIRSVLSAGEQYFDIMGVTLLEGRFYTREDADAGSKLVLLSTSVAEALYGSASLALDQYLETERGVMAIARGQGGQGGQGSQSAARNQALRMASERYRVIGVYQDPSELARSALGIPDAIIPFGAERPSGMSAVMPVRSIVVETDGTSPALLEERLAATLASLGIDETPISAWEGDPSTPNASAAAEARKTLSSLSGAITGLGALILLASVFGIYTSTAMDAADGRKGSAIRRAIGENSVGTAFRFASSSAVFGALAALVGAILSIPAYRALAKAAEGILGGAGMSQGGIFSAMPPLWAPLVAIVSTSVACALFSLPAAISASKASIVEGILEL